MQDTLQIDYSKYDWQALALKEIRKKVYGDVKSTDDFSLSPEKDFKSAVVYGLPQIGKTTLILFLLGVDSEYKYKDSQKTVYELLRGSSNYGNSSTSTAILYEQSENDDFVIENKICKSPEEVISAVDEIRKKVEENHFTKKIIHIALPKSAFFTESRENSARVRFLDMPGVDSKNEKEIVHVDAVYKQYLSLATVILVVCRADNIQSLSTLAENSRKKLSTHWESLSKYMIVLVNSYSLDSVKENFFNKEHKTGDFSSYIKNHYDSLIRQSENLPNCNVNIYPFDLGSSFESLKDKISAKDFDDAKETNSKMLKKFTDDIKTRRGNRFSSIVEDLKQEISDDVEKEISKYNEKIQEITKKNQKLESENKNREKIQELGIKKQVEKLDNKIIVLKTSEHISQNSLSLGYSSAELQRKIIEIIFGNIEITVVNETMTKVAEDLAQSSIFEISKNSLWIDSSSFGFHTKTGKIILGNRRKKGTDLAEYFYHHILHSESKMREKADEALQKMQNFILRKIDFDLIVENAFDESEDFSDDERKEFKTQLETLKLPRIEDASDFSKKNRYQFLEDFPNKINSYEEKIHKKIKEKFSEILNQKIKKLESEREALKFDDSNLSQITESKTAEIKKNEKKHVKLDSQKEERIKERDFLIAYLEDYKKVGKEKFDECKNFLFKDINSSNDKNQKMLLLLFWGTQEEIFNKFIGAL